jgi:AraC family transcriptional regulator, ethanolamine operon transcriptional activator
VTRTTKEANVKQDPQNGDAPARPGMRSLAADLRSYLDAHEDVPVHPTDLSTALSISDRHLRRVFLSIYGTTPGRYLKHRRMVLAKEKLESGAVERVLDVAHEFDFQDAGRFASDYRRLFQELPSEVLRRAGGRNEPPGSVSEN